MIIVTHILNVMPTHIVSPSLAPAEQDLYLDHNESEFYTKDKRRRPFSFPPLSPEPGKTISDIPGRLKRFQFLQYLYFFIAVSKIQDAQCLITNGRSIPNFWIIALSPREPVTQINYYGTD